MPFVRSERAADAAAIRAVHVASFPTPLEADLVDRLRANGRLVASLVAESEETVVGHVAFSPVATASDSVGFGLAPVAVAERHRRQGIADAMIRAGLDACRELGFGWGVVLGKPAYYGRFGFVAARSFGLVDEYGGGDAFQVIELRSGAAPIGGGLVRYSEEFADFS